MSSGQTESPGNETITMTTTIAGRVGAGKRRVSRDRPAHRARIAKQQNILKPGVKKTRQPSAGSRLRLGDLIVDIDWGSSGLWMCTKRGYRNENYRRHHLPKWLVTRFRYWTAWYNSHSPWNDEKIDYSLFQAYGRSLAVDLKRVVGTKRRVIFWLYGLPLSAADFELFEEIVLPDEKDVREYW